ncbi:capsule assembly Wzi family protein [Hymenobacter rubidus]|uniref:capsule assembly Wzi family protein n=1 Tax=Hymenobacter rubidus TaxID=1441626 RepID=UPI00191E543D|nr:capsule assembly Wzi family protein [Hymenobacter rubidus]
MKISLFLPFLLVPLAGPLAAQTAPEAPAPTPAPAPAKAAPSPWIIYDQPLDSLPAKRSRRATRPKAVRDTPTRATPARATAPREAVGSTEFEATQGTTYVPLDQDVYRLIDRYAIKFGSDSLHDPHTSSRPYSRAGVAHLGERMLSGDSAQAYRTGSLSRADRFNAQYLLKDNWANSPLGNDLNQSNRPFLNYFYRDQTDFYHVESKDFTLRANPVALLAAGRDNRNTDGLRYVNTRGVQVEGTIDQRLGFYAFLTDNQEGVPQYVKTRVDRDDIVPHEGYVKPFKAAVLDQGSQYDFFTARGYVTYAATKHINVQLGHDRNFIGNGYRSLILSDYSAPYFFLKLNTRVWKLNYQNLFTEMVAQKENADQVYPKKYMALHHLSLDVTKNFNIGLFESEVFGSASNRFELQYLNPIIFYRAIEQNVGSADNALLGLDFKWNVLHTAQLYGQVVLDEFKLSEIRARNGWWSNKQAVQVGAKYIDVAGIRNLDLQVELNYIRPYTYQHGSIYTAYTNYQQPLAHPMGANLTEVLGVLSYQPLPRLNLVAKAIYTEQGLDYGYDAGGQLITKGPIVSGDAMGNPITIGRIANYGGNPLTPYTYFPMEYGNRTGQGNKSSLLHTDFTATYQPRLNLFLDAKLVARHQTYSLTPSANVNEVYASLAVRWNIAQRLHEF